MYVFCLSCPSATFALQHGGFVPREWLAAKGLLSLIRESRTVLDSGFHAVDSGFQLLDSSLCQWNLDSGFHSLVGFRIPCLSCIPDSKTQDSRFNKQTFPGFRNPDFLTWGAKYPAILNERKLVNNTLFLGVHYSTTDIPGRHLLFSDKAVTSLCCIVTLK